LNIFRQILRFRLYKQILVEVSVFQRGGVTKRKFQVQGGPTNHCLYQKTRVIALSCGIKISAVYSFVLSQSMRVTARRTESQTELNYDPKTALA